MNPILVFFAEGFEEIEALTVVDLCRRCDLPVHMVSITDSLDVTGAHGICIRTDLLLHDATKETPSMLVLPGGMPGTKNLEACESLLELLKKHHTAKTYLAAICAAPSIFSHLGFLQGKTACCYPSFEEDLTLHGANLTQNPAKICEHIITGKGMGTAIDFSLLIIQTLLGKERATSIANSIVYSL